MAQHNSQSKTVERLDPVWDRLRHEAEEIARAEPGLGGFVYSSVLAHSSFENALMHRLAQRLGSADLGADAIVSAFGDALMREPDIGHAARADIIATFDRDPACHRYIDPLLYFKGWQALQAHRMAHRLWEMGRKDFALYLQSRSSIISSIDINPNARIGKGIMIDHGHDIVIGETSVIEDNVSILQGVTLGGTGKESGDRHPKIRQGVLIGAGAKILGNIEIGRCSRVAACSVVLHDVPPNTTVAGVPAKIVGKAGCAEPARAMDHNVESDDADFDLNGG
ncbi:serine O-acetyltransferase [Aestuariivirga litoralis]|uniref:serine O-acetyltransferase n=1 Tax=Aestuariivirga litoralis TaxID=2650924 RepID=UPI0018C79D6C|nr:serine O-acetyltransferase [Aestuariivirga litoralis]MBG1231290.1 serine O-acetyltransferase [Aestuariivirga litoralis]